MEADGGLVWPLTPAHVGVYRQQGAPSQAPPSSSEDAVAWPARQEEGERQTGPSHSHSLDLVTIRRSRSQMSLDGRPSCLQEARPSPRPSISLMDGSSAANVVRAGSGAGPGSSETHQYRPRCNHICLYTEGALITTRSPEDIS